MENNQFLKDLGSRASSRRKALGYTQEQLAERINVSVQMISNMESGKKAIRPENIVKLCIALEVSADYLLGVPNNQTIDISLLTNSQSESVRRIIFEFNKSNKK